MRLFSKHILIALAGVVSLAGCGDSKNSNTSTQGLEFISSVQDLGSGNAVGIIYIYPTDSKLSFVDKSSPVVQTLKMVGSNDSIEVKGHGEVATEASIDSNNFNLTDAYGAAAMDPAPLKAKLKNHVGGLYNFYISNSGLKAGTYEITMEFQMSNGTRARGTMNFTLEHDVNFIAI